MTQNVARRAYSAEQLLALRESASDEPAFKIETRAEDGAIKDHVLRNAHSFAARSTRSFAASDTLHPPSVDPRQHGGPVLGEIDPNNQSMRPDPKSYRPSPTPSLKKRKAEQILKDHGSPPGLRVTAGGRIVPSDQSPLCSPRFGYSAIQKNGGLIRFAPNYPPSSGNMLSSLQEASKNLPNGFVAQDPTGRLLQVVDGQFLVVNEVNGLPQLYIAAPNLNNFLPGKMGGNPMRQQTDQARGTSSTTGTKMRQPVLSISTQIQALDKQYVKLEQESRDLDKLEVLQRSTMSSKAYQQLIQTRRELVTRLNDIRISLKALREQQKNSPEQSSPQTDERESPQQQHMSFTGGIPVLPHGQMPQGHTLGWSFDGFAQEAPGMIPFGGGPMPMPPDLGYLFPQPGTFSGQMAPYPSLTAVPARSYPPMYNMMGVPPAEVFHGFSNVVDGPQTFPTQIPLVPAASGAQASVKAHGPRRALQDTGSSEKESPRRPHALEIKNPEIKSETGQGGKSSLNPMSPSYQPASVGTKPSTPQSNQARARADSPSPALVEAVRAHNAWVGESKAASKSSNSKRDFQYESSNASFTTADFFPNNPRDHSTNKQAYPAAGSRSMTSIKRADDARFSTPDETPNTPGKECHNPNWNPTIPDTVFDAVVTPPVDEETTVAPPGIPEQKNTSLRLDLVNNRSQNNMSLKSRRSVLLDSKSAGQVVTVDSEPTSPAADHGVQPRKSSASSSRLPISNSGSAYNEGYRAGEARLPIGPDSSGVWLDGYCAGLRASMKDNTSQEASSVPYDLFGKDASSGARSLVSKASSQSIHGQGISRQSPHDSNNSDISKLKDAVFSSQNENVLLSPESDGPVVSEMTSHRLGGWTKQHGPPSSTESVLTQLRNGEAGFSERTGSMVQRQLVGSGVTSKNAKAGGGEGKTAAVSEPRRNFSVQSQPSAGSSSSYLKAVYPGHRVLSSQLEWKSGSSIAQVAGLAHGYVAQYDGTLNDLAALDDMAPLTRMSGNAGTANPDTKLTPKKSGPSSPSGYPRFVEGSMKSDEQSLGCDPTSSSPSRKSPTKAKFAHIAGKAGIKVRVDEQVEQERLSPKEKPRWRDVWRKGH